MKKTLLIVVSILMTFSLVACAGNQSASSKSSRSESAPSTDATDRADEGNETESSTDTADRADEGNKTESGTNATDGSVDTTTESQLENREAETNVLVAYFSATGTTKKIAQYAADEMGADLYEITPADPYTTADLDYNTDCRANREMDDETCRPEISGSVENMEDYDIVFIGYPIWWGEAPRIVSTFVESYDFLGKTVVTFSTSGSSGHNDGSIKSDGANWITGTRFSSSASQSDVADWISGLGLDITMK